MLLQFRNCFVWREHTSMIWFILLVIVNTYYSPFSHRPRRSNLSKYLIALLSYGGVPRTFFLDLLTSVLEETNAVFTNKRAAFKGDLRFYLSCVKSFFFLLLFWEVYSICFPLLFQWNKIFRKPQSAIVY